MQPNRLSRLFLLVLPFLALFLPSALHAASDGAAPGVETVTLENGLQVVAIPDRRAPVVTHSIWYRAGSADEPPGKSGIAHFLEHLMFKGTSTHRAGEFSAAVARNGGEENAFTTVDYTAYYQKVAPDLLSDMMAFEADRMRNLVLDEEAVATERLVILEERRQRVDASAGAILGEAKGAALYRNHPYRIPIIGWQHEMEALTLADALDFYRRFYAPNNAVLVVAGDVDPAEVFRLAGQHYGPIPAGEPVIRKRPSEPPPTSARTVTYEDPRVAEPGFSRDYLAPAYSTAAPLEAEALDLLAAIVGGSLTSRMQRELVVGEKLAVSARAYYQGGYLDSGEFNFSLRPAPGVDIAVLEARLDRMIDDLRVHGVTQQELDRARNSLLKSVYFERDSQTSLLRLYGTVLTTGGTVEDIAEWPQRLAAVRVEDVNAAARNWLDRRRSVTGYLLPRKEPTQ
jgi:zinc protease